jgi:hypothetical protein
MRGNQLSYQWRVIWVIEASPKGLTVTGIAKREESDIRTNDRAPKALLAEDFPFYTERVERPNRSALTNIFKFQFPKKLKELK